MVRDWSIISRRLVEWLILRRRTVLWVALALSLIGTFFAVQLYRDLRSEVEALLPVDAPSVVAAKTVGGRLHNVNHLSVVLEGSNPEALQRFADDLAQRLRVLPAWMVGTVDYRTDEEQAFIKRFGLFYLSTEDLKTILKRVKERIAWEKQRANPLLGLVDPEETPPPSLDFKDIESKYSQYTEAQGVLGQFRQGYYQTPDGRLLGMIIRPPEAGTGYSFQKALWDRVKNEVSQLNPHAYDPTMQVGYDGEVASLVEEQEALVADLASSTAVVLIFVMLALWIYYRRWGAIGAIVGSLACGCAVTFGIGYFLVGHLNANTAFLGSIVVGNGINVAIIVCARYVEERRDGLPVDAAIHTAIRQTFGATFIAAFASGLSYVSLSLTNFRGFREFGVLGGLGMALCWLSSMLLLPPLLASIEAWRPLDVLQSHRTNPVTSRIVRLVERYRSAIQASALVSLAVVSIAVASYRGELIEYDVTKLRAQKSLKSGAVYWGHKFDQIFNAYLTPIVIVGDTVEDLDRVVAKLGQRRTELGPSDPLREVRTIRNVLPQNQEEKISILRELRATVTDARLALMSPELREKAEKLRPPPDIRPAALADLPHFLRLPLTERDGRAGRIALAFPRHVGVLDSHDLEEITQVIRGAIAAAGGRAQAVGQALLFADILAAVKRDGPKATVLAFAAVSMLVMLVFRRVRPSVTVLSGLLLGVAWLVGLAAAAQVRVNFLNFVVLPITFGIGVDYAVNIVMRYQLEGIGSLPRVLRETGGAVALCSSTTIIGYSSLIVADNRALSGFGLLASVGELSCLTAALIVLPAWVLGRESVALRRPTKADL